MAMSSSEMGKVVAGVFGEEEPVVHFVQLELRTLLSIPVAMSRKLYVT